MHISEGVLSAPVLLTGAAGTLVGLSVGIRKMSPHEIPKVALLTAAFFVASLVHVPIGPSNAHLILNGLLVILLGWCAFPAIFIGLTLQAILFQFGGLTTLGINTLNMALPAVIMGAVARPVISNKRQLISIGLAGVSGMASVLLSGVMVALSLFFSGDSFMTVSKLIFVAHIPISIIEGIISAAIVSFLLRVRPEMFFDSKKTGPGYKAAILLVTTLLASCLLIPHHAHAHRVNLFVWYDGEKIEGEGYYASGKKAVNVPVRVFDEQGKEIATLSTDKEGEFNFSPPHKGNFHIVLEAGLGHKAEADISVSPKQDEEQKAQTVTADQEGEAELAKTGPARDVSSKTSPAVTTSITIDDIDRLLDKRLKPIEMQIVRLAEEQSKVRPQDIIGGLGYIFGLMGMAMYILAKKERNKETRS